MSRLIVAGIAAPDGLYVRQGDGFRKLDTDRTPIVHLLPCRWCGRYFGCDCQDWLEWLAQAQPVSDGQEGDDAA